MRRARRRVRAETAVPEELNVILYILGPRANLLDQTIVADAADDHGFRKPVVPAPLVVVFEVISGTEHDAPATERDTQSDRSDGD